MKKMLLICLLAMIVSPSFSACNKDTIYENSITDNIVNQSTTTAVKITDESVIDELLTIKIANDAQINDTVNYTHYYDEKTTFQSWKIIIESSEKLENFKFVELDESEKLRVADTIFELECLEANKPLLIHTYINDVTLNRGISFQDEKGSTFHYGISSSMFDGSLSFSEIHLNENYVNSDSSSTVDKDVINVNFDILNTSATAYFEDCYYSGKFYYSWKDSFFTTRDKSVYNLELTGREKHYYCYDDYTTVTARDDFIVGISQIVSYLNVYQLLKQIGGPYFELTKHEPEIIFDNKGTPYLRWKVNNGYMVIRIVWNDELNDWKKSTVMDYCIFSR